MYNADEKDYLTSCLNLNREYVDSFFDGDMHVLVQTLKAVNNGKLESYLERKIKKCLSRTNSGFRDAFLIFYLSDDIEDDKAEYSLESTIVKIGRSGKKVLEVMSRDSFVRWTKNSEVLNKFLAFS